MENEKKEKTAIVEALLNLFDFDDDQKLVIRRMFVNPCIAMEAMKLLISAIEEEREAVQTLESLQPVRILPCFIDKTGIPTHQQTIQQLYAHLAAEVLEAHEKAVLKDFEAEGHELTDVKTMAESILSQRLKLDEAERDKLQVDVNYKNARRGYYKGGNTI